MVKQTVHTGTLHPYQEILLSNKKEKSTNTCNNLDESQGITLSEKFSLKRVQIMLFHSYYNLEMAKVQKWRIY